MKNLSSKGSEKETDLYSLGQRDAMVLCLKMGGKAKSQGMRVASRSRKKSRK